MIACHLFGNQLARKLPLPDPEKTSLYTSFIEHSQISQTRYSISTEYELLVLGLKINQIYDIAVEDGYR